MGKKKKAGADFSKELEDIEKRKYNLDVLERILKERDETLALHEQKMLAIKKEYEKKLEDIEKRERDFNAKSRDAKHFDHERNRLNAKLEKLRKESRIAETLLLERRKEIEKTKEKEMSFRIETSRVEKELKRHQKRFDELHSAIARMDSHLKKKQNELETASYQLGMKKHEYNDIKRQIDHLKKQHEKLEAEVTYDLVNEIKVLTKRIDDHLRHSDFERARKDYSRLREMYSQLSREEKKRIYGKVAKSAVALT